jgi:hypothetical protein
MMHIHADARRRFPQRGPRAVPPMLLAAAILLACPAAVAELLAEAPAGGALIEMLREEAAWQYNAAARAPSLSTPSPAS